MNNFLLESGKQQRIYNDKTDEQKNAEFVKKKIESLPENATLSEKIAVTGGSGKLSQSEMESLDQAFVAIDLVASTEKQMRNLGIPLQGNEFGGWFSKLKKFAAPFTGQDVSNIDSFKSTLIQSIPVLAKGVFKETGVLTDEDVRRYSSTIASIENTPESNERVMAATQSLIARLTRNQLRRSVDGGKNVTAYQVDAKRLEKMPMTSYWVPKSIQGDKEKVNNHVLKAMYEDLVYGEAPVISPGELSRYWTGEKWVMITVPSLESFTNSTAKKDAK
jgi:hypothetical protein